MSAAHFAYGRLVSGPSLEQLRDTVNSDAHAMTFQSFGQYRTEILKQINHLLSRGNAGEPILEANMQSTEKLSLLLSTYPPEHPYPVAVRQLSALQRLVFSGVVVQLTELTRYRTSPYGGMVIDEEYGPWVTLLDVMGRSRTTHTDDIAIAFFSSKMHATMEGARKKGKRGWDDPSMCTPRELADLLVKNASEGDFVSVANYAMMLDQRRADPEVLVTAIDAHARTQNRMTTMILVAFGKYVAGYRPGVDGWTAQDQSALDAATSCRADCTPPPPVATTPLATDAAHTFAQALIAQGWHNDDPDCVDGLQRLLQGFLATNACEVKS